MATSTLSTILSALTGTGLSSTSIASAVAAIAGNSVTSTVEGLCTSVLQNSANPSVVKDLANKIAEVNGLTIAVANMLPELTAAANATPYSPMAVVQVVQAIETALGPQSSGFSLGSLL
jgi:hypothetical protein